MNFLQAIVLSVVEGATEFLPVSSTGHLILAADIMNLGHSDFLKTFEIIIQLGAILGVAALYFRFLLENLKIIPKIVVAFIPTAVAGFLLYPLIKSNFLENTSLTLLALFFGGVLLILLELVYKEKDHHLDKVEDLSFTQALSIGAFQGIAIVPGVSRAAATIIGGLFLGLKRKAAVEFSFLLAIPTIFGASVLSAAKSDFASYTFYEYQLLAVTLVGSFVFATLSVKFLLSFIEKNSFIPFGIYRIILAIMFWLTIVR